MSDNLYAPPQAELGSGADAASGTGDIDLGRCLSDGWANTWANFPLWLVVGLVGLLATAAAVVTILGIVLAVPVLMWGGFVFFLRMHDGGAQLGDLFSGFSRYGQALAGMLGFWLVTAVIGVLGQVPLIAAQAAESGVGIAIGNLINLAVAFLVTPRLTFAAFLMVDRDMRLGEALSMSWERTGPVKWKIAGLMVLMVAVMLGGLIALVIGVIPASVVAYLMWSSAYRQVFGGAPRPAA
jgi:hypothetical protein